MVVVPLSKLPNEVDAAPNAPTHPQADPVNWVRFASAATLVAGGALLLGGKRRSGLVAAATGTTLALLDQQDTLKKWWLLLPGFIVDVQQLLTQVQKSVDEMATQRDKLGKVLGR